MITFRSMLTHRSAPQHSLRHRLIRLLAGAAAALALASPDLHAQLTLTHTEDAAPIPAGMLRFRVIPTWTRWDSRFTTNGVQSLDDEISSDSLGRRQLPFLGVVESGLQTLTNNPLTRLTLGRLNAQSDIRIVNAPIALEFGVTSRLSIGVMVPFIQSRRNLHFSVNADSTRLANVGFIPDRTRA